MDIKIPNKVKREKLFIDKAKISKEEKKKLEKNGNVFIVDDDLLTRAGPRMGQSVKELYSIAQVVLKWKKTEKFALVL